VLRSDFAAPCAAGFAEQGALLRRVARMLILRKRMQTPEGQGVKLPNEGPRRPERPKLGFRGARQVHKRAQNGTNRTPNGTNETPNGPRSAPFEPGWSSHAAGGQAGMAPYAVPTSARRQAPMGLNWSYS